MSLTASLPVVGVVYAACGMTNVVGLIEPAGAGGVGQQRRGARRCRR
jgi:hypothetical protein